MSALRRAGVWLGLIEDEDDRGYDERYRDRGYRSGQGFDLDDEDEIDDAPVPRARATDRLVDRDTPRDSGRSERVALRSIARPASASASHSYGTRENLALAPQVQLRERAVVADDDDRRYQITTLHPTTYNEARTIGEHFRNGVPVIMNLTEMDEADAKRLVDFAAGLAFGLRGTIERVTNRVFLLSPANVQVTAEDKAKIAEGGFFNQS
jgi:cell division inhibitor SepF